MPLRNNTAKGGSSPASCSAWVPVSNPPSDFTRIIAKNEDDAIADCVWLSKPKPGCYVIIPGAGAQRWQWATHYIPWPNSHAQAREPSPDATGSEP
jgi:hypothetical protein